MILYKKELVKFVNQDAIKLNVGEDKGYIYLSIDVYKQALLLSDRFEGEITLIKKRLGLQDSQEKAVSYFYENTPEPVNILAPFLGLVDISDYILTADISQLCGVLHMLSLLIDFDNYLKVPEDIRKDVSFTNLDLMDYEEKWEALQESYKINELKDYEILSQIIKETVSAVAEEFYSTHQVTSIQQDIKDYDDILDSDSDDYDPWAAMNTIMEEELNKTSEQEQQNIKAKAEIKEDKEENSSTENELEEPEEAEETENSIYDKIAALYGGVK